MGGGIFFFSLLKWGGMLNVGFMPVVSFAQIESTQEPGDSRCFWHDVLFLYG